MGKIFLPNFQLTQSIHQELLNMNTEKNSNNNVATNNKGERVGLWVGLGAAALTAIGVVGLAIYTDYKESNGTQTASGVSQVAESPSSIPTSEAHAASIAAQNSDVQVQGMEAPSDEEPAIAAVASHIGVASDVVHPIVPASAAASAAQTAQLVEPTVVQSPVAAVSAPVATSAPSPADKILAKENAIQAESKVVEENGVVRFYFATGKADVTANTLESLKSTVEGAKAGKKVVILTYSNVESNERLARDRALAVRSVLLAAGIPDSSIEVSNPTAESSDSRRVEVVLR